MNPFQSDIAKLKTSIGQMILGKDDVIENVLICLMAQGHLLIEDVPGVGKTTLAVALARSIDGAFQRIQFTSDLLPSDVLGVPIYNEETRQFEFRPGPIFAHIVLADEINRTTPKTQSALLEAMQEGKVSVERVTYDLPHPFMVLATQNPIEFHGTYPLPESQLDRFMMRITMGYPLPAQELRILETKGHLTSEFKIAAVVTPARISEMQRGAAEMKMDASISKYLLEIIARTRSSRDLELGASPRSALALFRAVQARAFVQGRTFVTPDDVKTLALPVLAHRVILSGRKAASSTSHDLRMSAETILQGIVNAIEVPM